MSATAGSPPAVGSIPPDFSLRDQYGATVQLSALTGRTAVAVVFFPLAFSDVCGAELRALRDDADLFARHDVVVLGVSVDPIASLRAVSDVEQLPFRLLSDFWPHGEVAQRYGAFDATRGVATRTTVLVNNSGRTAAVLQAPLGEPRDPAEYRRALEALRAGHERLS